MRKKMFISITVLFFMTVSVIATENQEGKGPRLSFDKESQDYGTMNIDSLPEDNQFNLDIYFTNTGDEPLIISNVRACCGTRVKEYPEHPIMPGSEEIINVEFRLAPRAQRISRTVTVTSNCEGNPRAIYRIAGEVVEEVVDSE